MAEYIKRTDAMTICERYSQHCFESSDASGQDIADRILDDIAEMHTADVVEVKHGEWIRHKPNTEQMKKFHDLGIGKALSINSIYWTCSCCDSWGTPRYNYCQNCGADMRGDKNDL